MFLMIMIIIGNLVGVTLLELFLFFYCFHLNSWTQLYDKRDYIFKHPETNIGIFLRIIWFPTWLIIQVTIKIYLAIKYRF